MKQLEKKEFYNPQFIVKEPEFIIPYAWYVVVDKKNLNILSNWLHPNNDFKLPIEGIVGICNHLIGKNPKGYNRNKTIKSNYYDFGVEITFEQFKKYILKEQLETPKDKVLLRRGEPYLNAPFNITKVECSEGGIYQLGDKITVFTKSSPNKGKLLTIKGFRWSKDNSNICAITEVHSVYGIGLNLIELYSEPVVKDIFVLPKNWYIIINDENVHFVKKWWNFKNYGTRVFSKNAYYGLNNNSSYSNNNCPQNSTEITFNQFKKYVLNETI